MTMPPSAYTTRSSEVVTTTRRQNSTRRGSTVLRSCWSWRPTGEAGAGCHAWPPALSDQEITNTRHAIAQYLIEATAAEPAERL